MKQYPYIAKPNQLSDDMLTGSHLPFYSARDDKPTIARIADRLVLLTMHHHVEDVGQGNKATRHYVQYTSDELGQSWGRGHHVPISGEANLFTLRDGTLVCLAMGLHPNWSGLGIRLPGCPAYSKGYWDGRVVFRSCDGGETWAYTPITLEMLPDSPDFDKVQFQGPLCGSYNLVEINDTAIITVYNTGRPPFHHWILRSTDGCQSFTAQRMVFTDSCMQELMERNDLPYTPLNESVLFLSESGRFYMVCRADLRLLAQYDIPGMIVPSVKSGIDQDSGLLLFESPDGGTSWKLLSALGVPGMMYTHFLPLDDGSVLMTYTMRMVPRPEYGFAADKIGVYASILHEDPERGLVGRFDEDVIVIDDSTHPLASGAGGYGNTIQLPDGSFVTPYSYNYVTPELVERLEKKLYLDRDAYEEARRTTSYRDNDYSFKDNMADALKKHLYCDYFMAEKELQRPCTGILHWTLTRR